MSFGLNILLADDNEDDVFLVKEAFKKAGVSSRIEIVRDGLEAVAYLEGKEPFSERATHPLPDVLLLDVNMPGMNGFEVLEWIRRDAPCKRLIVHMLTASSRPSDVERAYDFGANSYIVKTSRFQELVQFVKTLHEWHRFVSRCR
ncbi:MAG TPA: response regulator [Verrucomicrobiae bacterium]|nr:response regulator [Verrucomicrobiae bacterium]